MALHTSFYGSNTYADEAGTSSYEFHTCWLYAPEVSWAGEMVFAECVPARYLHEFTSREACKKCRLEAYKKQQRRQARKVRWQARWGNVKSCFEGGRYPTESVRLHTSKSTCGSSETLCEKDCQTSSTLTRSESWGSSTTARTDSAGSQGKSVDSKSSSTGSIPVLQKAHTDRPKQIRSETLKRSGGARRSYTDVFRPGERGLVDWRIVLAASAIV